MSAHATEMRVEQADESNEAGLRELLRNNPLAGDIVVTLEREPNALHAAATGGDSFNILVGYRHGQKNVVACGARFELDAFVNGDVRRVGYLGEFRMDGGLRQRRRMLIESFTAMREAHEAGNVKLYFTTVVADNVAARRLFEAGLPGFPVYEPREEIVTLTIPVQSGARVRTRSRHIRQASENDEDAIATLLQRTGSEYQFHPVWDRARLASQTRCRGLSTQDFFLCESTGGPIGCLALWDQRGFKQTVISGYANRLRRLRPFYNAVAPLVRRPTLPAPGSRLETTFLSHLAVAPDDEETLHALVAAACRDAAKRELDYVMLGIAKRDPVHASLCRVFSCHAYTSMLYTAFWKDGADAAAALDQRIPRPEMAIL
ncbi:MAG: hypothetical protein KJO31_13680 [Gammaproteobacteria bacterium]|nr:hypothetical protein [Gammaproteobacteria bacterium]